MSHSSEDDLCSGWLVHFATFCRPTGIDTLFLEPCVHSLHIPHDVHRESFLDICTVLTCTFVTQKRCTFLSNIRIDVWCNLHAFVYALITAVFVTLVFMICLCRILLLI